MPRVVRSTIIDAPVASNPATELLGQWRAQQQVAAAE